MARLLTCGFELKDTTAEGIANLTATTFSTTSPNGGAVCINCVSATSAASCCQFSTFTGALSTDYWVRFYIKISANVANAVRVWTVNGSGGVLIFIRLNANGTLDLLDSASATIGSSSAALTPGTWTRVEVYFNIATATTGKCELRVNGSTVTGTNVTNANLGTTTPATFFLGWNVAAISTATVSFDDFALNNGTAGAGGTTWPGDGKIVALVPASDNAVGTGWTNDNAATTGLFNSVNKSPPTGIADTTTGGGGHQIRNATSNANVNYIAALTTYTAAGIGSADTITLLQHVVATGAPSATSAKTGSAFASTNPIESGTGALTFYQGTTVAGAYPTGWQVVRGPVTDVTHGINSGWPVSATYGTAPLLTVTQVTSSTRIAMCCLMALIVEYVPGAPPQVILPQQHHRTPVRGVRGRMSQGRF